MVRLLTKKPNVDLKTYKQLFEALSVALYFDEDRKRYHGISTALLGEKLAKLSGLVAPERIFYGGLIHDLGGIGLNHHIIHYALGGHYQKDDPSSSDIFQAKYHGHIGAGEIGEYEGFNWATEIIRDHHERYDGTGLPEGKSGKEVPIGAEVLGAADILDIFLYSLEIKNHLEPKETRVDSFRKFLGTHGGFRDRIREWILAIASQEQYIDSLLSIQALESKIVDKMAKLSPPGDVRLDDIIRLLGSVIDIKSNYTEDHSARVARLGEKVGKRLGMTDKELQDYRYGAYLHDLGKVGIDRTIINKPDSLTEQEYEKVKKHPKYSEETLEEIEELGEVAKIAGHHQEYYDGSGYPRGLEGEQIKLGARIIAVVDAWDAMTSDRPYRDALSEEEAIKELKVNSGSQFDPQVVKEFLKLHKEGLS